MYFNLLPVNRTFRVNVVHPVVGHVHAKTLKRGFTLKTNQIFVVYATLEEFDEEAVKEALVNPFTLVQGPPGERTLQGHLFLCFFKALFCFILPDRIDRENHIIVIF